MGSILKAECQCGFESEEILAGGGMDFHRSCRAPALCPVCKIFLVKNYMKKFSKCPTCRRKIVFYDDPIIQADSKTEDYVFEWNLPFDNGTGKDVFKLPDTQYLCPKCGKMNMKFIDYGCWD